MRFTYVGEDVGEEVTLLPLLPLLPLEALEPEPLEPKEPEPLEPEEDPLAALVTGIPHGLNAAALLALLALAPPDGGMAAICIATPVADGNKETEEMLTKLESKLAP